MHWPKLGTLYFEMKTVWCYPFVFHFFGW